MQQDAFGNEFQCLLLPITSPIFVVLHGYTVILRFAEVFLGETAMDCAHVCRKHRGSPCRKNRIRVSAPRTHGLLVGLGQSGLDRPMPF